MEQNTWYMHKSWSIMKRDMLLRQCKVHNIDSPQYVTSKHQWSIYTSSLYIYTLHDATKIVQSERMFLSTQASPRPYLQANRFALCEGPGILRLGCGTMVLWGLWRKVMLRIHQWYWVLFKRIGCLSRDLWRYRTTWPPHQIPHSYPWFMFSSHARKDTGMIGCRRRHTTLHTVRSDGGTA